MSTDAERLLRAHRLVQDLAKRIARHHNVQDALLELSTAALELTGFGCGQVYVLDGDIWVGRGGAQCEQWQECTVCNTDPRFTAIFDDEPVVLRRDTEPGRSILADAPSALAQVLVAPVLISRARSCVLVLRSDDGATVVDRQTLDLVQGLTTLAALAIESARAVEAEASRSAAMEAEHRRREELLQVLRHDVSSPLSVVIGSAEILAARGHQMERDDCDRMLQGIADAARRVHRLVNDATQIVATQATSSLPVRVEPLDLKPLFERLSSTIPALAERHDFVIEADHDLPPVLADTDRVHQIMGNLIDNAVNHTRGGRIEVLARRDGDDVSVLVRDEGPGVPEGEADRVFERFERAAEDGVPGSGLGLHIARSLARAMGGEVTLVPTPGRNGATFELRLVAASPTAAGRTRQVSLD